MDFEWEQEPPRLSLYSLPSKMEVDPPGTLTPPMETLVSVPFQWEEAPGKPRPCCVDGDKKPKRVVRCLELPPRLLTDQAKSSGLPSPTTVLDGPYSGGGRSLRKGGSSFRSPPGDKERFLLGSTRWGSLKKSNSKEVGGGFEFLFSDVNGGDGDGTKVKITRVKKRSNNILTSLYERCKQVVPQLSWNRRSRKGKRVT